MRFDATVNGNGGGGAGNGGADSSDDRRVDRRIPCSSPPIRSPRRTQRTATTRSRSTRPSTARSREASSGFVGAASDGLVQLDAAHALTTTYEDAVGGNVVQTAKVALELVERGKTVLALGFGASQEEAVDTAEGSLAPGFAKAHAAYVKRLEALRQAR